MNKKEDMFIWMTIAILVGVSATYSLIVLSESAYRIATNFIVEMTASKDGNIIPIYNQASIISTQDIEILEVKDATSLLFVGDIMLDRGVEQIVDKYGNGDFSYLFSKIKELENVDILFGNLEGPISNKGKNVGSIYSFRMNTNVSDTLTDAGFDILSVANNHIGDWGKEAFFDTLERLSASGIKSVGQLDANFENGLVIIEKNGTTFGYLAFSDVGPSWLNTGEAPYLGIAGTDYSKKLIASASSIVDVLIVSYHFGNEYEGEQSKRQEELAKEGIDLGALIIIGHHPHVAQPVISYKGGIIVYSLGNFIFDQNFSSETLEGLVLEVIIEDGKISKVKQGISRQNIFYQPEIYSWCGEFTSCKNDK